MSRYDDFRERPFRRGPGWSPPRDYDRNFRRPPGRYDREFPREPFMPEWARRHPEYERSRAQRRDHEPSRFPQAPGEPTDSEILDAVCEKMSEDGYIESDGIEVTVQNGVVTLRGEVADYMQARYAWDDAWETEGVRGVLNHLTVRTDPSGA